MRRGWWRWWRRWLQRRPILATGLTLLCLGSAHHYRDTLHSANESVRIYTALALVDHGTVALDPVFDDYFPGWRARGRPPNMDVAVRDGRYLLDKAPGISLLAVPVIAVARGLGLRPSYSTLAWLLTLLLAGLPSVLAVWFLWRWLATRLGPWPALVAPALLLASPWLIYGTLLFGHALAASLVAIGVPLALGSPWSGGRGESDRDGPGALEDGDPAMGGLPDGDPAMGGLPERRHAVLGGLCLGGAVLVEYPAAVVALAVLVALAASGPGRARLQWLVMGAAGPALALFAWHWILFGGPLALPYAFKADPSLAATHAEGLYGIGWPRGEALWGILFSARRGLLPLAPWLAAGLMGIIWAAADRRLARPFRVGIPAAGLAGLALIAGFGDWHGGRAVGPRYLVFLLPVLGLGAALLVHRALAAGAGGEGRGGPGGQVILERLLRWRPAAAAAILGLLCSSLLISLAPATGYAHVSESIANPIFEVVLPVLQAGGPGPTAFDGLLPPLAGLIIGASSALAALGLWFWITLRPAPPKIRPPAAARASQSPASRSAEGSPEGGQQRTNGQLTDGQPADGQPTDDQPADGRPADSQPADGRPAGVGAASAAGVGTASAAGATSRAVPLHARPPVLAAIGLAAGILHLTAASLEHTGGASGRRRVLLERMLAHEVQGNLAEASRLARRLSLWRRGPRQQIPLHRPE